jgi:hypothetical protein
MSCTSYIYVKIAKKVQNTDMYLHVAGISAYHMSGGMKNFSFYFQADTQVGGGGQIIKDT